MVAIIITFYTKPDRIMVVNTVLGNIGPCRIHIINSSPLRVLGLLRGYSERAVGRIQGLAKAVERLYWGILRRGMTSSGYSPALCAAMGS